MYLDLQGYYRRQPEPPPPPKREYRQLSKREQKVLLWAICFNFLLLLIAPIGGATVIEGLISLFAN